MRGAPDRASTRGPGRVDVDPVIFLPGTTLTSTPACSNARWGYRDQYTQTFGASHLRRSSDDKLCALPKSLPFHNHRYQSGPLAGVIGSERQDSSVVATLLSDMGNDGSSNRFERLCEASQTRFKRTGISLIPLMKFDRIRRIGPQGAALGNRFRNSSKKMRNCNSASRAPRQ